MTTFVQVSIGELIDKITILSIKLARITENKKLINIQKEYDMLNQSLSKIYTVNDLDKEQIVTLTETLKNVNETIWDIENKKRYHESIKDFGSDFIELARGVYKQNDERARIKRVINDLYNSEIIEEKCHILNHS